MTRGIPPVVRSPRGRVSAQRPVQAVLGLLVLALVGPVLPCAASPPASAPFAEFEKALEEALQADDPSVRVHAFDVLQACRDVRAVDLVVEAIGRLLGERERIGAAQAKHEARYEAAFDEQLELDDWFAGSRRSPREFARHEEGRRKVQQRLDEVGRELAALEVVDTRLQTQVEGAERALSQVLARLEGDARSEGLDRLDAAWAASRRDDEKLRWLDVWAALADDGATQRLREVLARATEPAAVRAAALEALADRDPPLALDAALHRLQGQDEPWDLTVAAIRVLERLRDPRAIEPLIAFLGRDGLGRLREDARSALVSLTGEAHGPYQDPWRRWWEEAKPGFQVSAAPGTAPRTDAPPEGATFYGIHTFSRRVLFVLDVSGSMEQVPATEPGRGSPPPKIDVARRELLAFVDGLDDGDLFNVLLFDHEVHLWQPKMVEASNATKRRARSFVEKTGPRGGTNVYDALDTAFGIALARTAAPVVDTVFFLTDGRPTAGRIQREERILRDVAAWNRRARLTVHCVGVGDHDTEFLRALARIGRGEYVRR